GRGRAHFSHFAQGELLYFGMGALHQLRQQRARIIGQVVAIEQLQRKTRAFGVFRLFEQWKKLGVLVFVNVLLAQTAQQRHQRMRTDNRRMFCSDVLKEPAARLRTAKQSQKSDSRDGGSALLLDVEITCKVFDLGKETVLLLTFHFAYHRSEQIADSLVQLVAA